MRGGGRYGLAMTNSEDESGAEPAVGISDDQLPEDLVPGEDNPLAESLEDGDTVDDLLADGSPTEEPTGDGPGATEG